MKAVVKVKIFKMLILIVFALIAVLSSSVSFGSNFGGGESGGGGAGEGFCQPDYEMGILTYRVPRLHGDFTYGSLWVSGI